MKTRMLFVLMSIAAVALFWHSTGCKKNPVAPEVNLRELDWSVTKLEHEANWQNFLDDMWANNSADIYVCGSASTTTGLLWHYNGSDWRDVVLGVNRGGTIPGVIDLHAAFGFAANDVWCAGTRRKTNPQDPDGPYLRESLIIHFDGSGWQEVPNPGGAPIWGIWGRSPDDVWFVGQVSTVFHFNGQNLEKVALPAELAAEGDSTWVPLRITGNAEKAYMIVPHRETYPNALLELVDGQWRIIDKPYPFGWSSMWVSPQNRLYVVGGFVHRLVDGKFEDVFVSETDGAIYLFGTAEDNLLLTTIKNTNGHLYHYNGQDWQLIYTAPGEQTYFHRVWTDNREVVISGRVLGDQAYIWHGK